MPEHNHHVHQNLVQKSNPTGLQEIGGKVFTEAFPLVNAVKLEHLSTVAAVVFLLIVLVEQRVCFYTQFHGDRVQKLCLGNQDKIGGGAVVQKCIETVIGVVTYYRLASVLTPDI